MMTAKQALVLNSTVISSDQYEYQMALESNFSELLASLSSILNEPLLMAQVQVDSLIKRSSQHYLNLISSPGGVSSNAWYSKKTEGEIPQSSKSNKRGSICEITCLFVGKEEEKGNWFDAFYLSFSDSKVAL